MNCKNCTYYITETDGLSGECKCPKFHLGYGNPYGADFVDYGKRVRSMDTEPDCVRVEYDESWGFRVGRDFGCIHFKVK